MPRLILFEGLPGCGKSTLSQDFYLQRCRLGDPVLWIAEDQRPHPLIVESGLTKIDGPRSLAEYATAQWQKLADDALKSDSTLVLDAALFGMTLGALLRHDSPRDLLTETCSKIETALVPLEPRLIYLRPEDAAFALDEVLCLRGQAWAGYMADQLTGCPFGQRHKSSDVVRAYYGALSLLFDSTYDRLSLSKHAVTVVHGDLEQTRSDVHAALDTNAQPPISPSANWLESLSGTYRCTEDDAALRLRNDGDDLVIDQDQGSRLVHADNNAFMVLGMPVEVTFDVNADGLTRAIFCDRTAGSADVPTEWVKV